MRNFLGFLTALSLSLFSTLSFGRGFYSGAQSLSLVDSGRAGLASGEAALLNPSLLGLNKGEIFLTYLDGTPEENRHTTNYGITIVDTSQGTFANGALSYRDIRRFGQGLTQPADGVLWHGALGKIISPHLIFGVSVYNLRYQSPAQDIPDQWNGSLGLTYLVNSNLGFAYVADSIARPSDRVPLLLREERTHAVGAYYKPYEKAHVRFDLSQQERNNPSDHWDASFSFEVETADWMKLRLGHKWEGLTDQNRLGLGLGFEGPRTILDYGFQQNLSNSETMHGVDLRILF